MAQLSAEKKVLQWDGAALQSTGSSRRILVVDDSPDILKLISRMLEQVGCLVDSAGNAHSAMGRLNRPMAECAFMVGCTGSPTKSPAGRFFR